MESIIQKQSAKVESCYEFSSFDEMLLAEVLIDNFDVELCSIKKNFFQLKKDYAGSFNLREYDSLKRTLSSLVKSKKQNPNCKIKGMMVIY